LAREPATSGNAFGAEVREAMDRRVDHLVDESLARRQGLRVVFARDLLNTLRQRDLDEVSARVAAETGLAHRPSAEGEHVAGIYRQRVSLSSGRFAMIDNGLGFPARALAAGAGAVPGETGGGSHVSRRNGRLELRTEKGP